MYIALHKRQRKAEAVLPLIKQQPWKTCCRMQSFKKYYVTDVTKYQVIQLIQDIRPPP